MFLRVRVFGVFLLVFFSFIIVLNGFRGFIWCLGFFDVVRLNWSIIYILFWSFMIIRNFNLRK